MTIDKIFTKAKKLNVIVVGDSMLDSYKIGSVTRQSPEADVPIVDIEKKSKKLGGAANVILNLKQLGINPILCSVIGDDENGREIISLLKKNNLDTGGIIIDNSRKIESIKSAVEDSGNRDEDVAVMKLSESVREKSSDLVNFMGDIKNTIIEETGGKDAKTGIKGYKNIDFAVSYTHLTLPTKA